MSDELTASEPTFASKSKQLVMLWRRLEDFDKAVAQERPEHPSLAVRRKDILKFTHDLVDLQPMGMRAKLTDLTQDGDLMYIAERTRQKIKEARREIQPRPKGHVPGDSNDEYIRQNRLFVEDVRHFLATAKTEGKRDDTHDALSECRYLVDYVRQVQQVFRFEALQQKTQPLSKPQQDEKENDERRKELIHVAKSYIPPRGDRAEHKLYPDFLPPSLRESYDLMYDTLYGLDARVGGLGDSLQGLGIAVAMKEVPLEMVRFHRQHLDHLASAFRSDVCRLVKNFPEEDSPLNTPTRTIEAAYRAQWALCADRIAGLMKRYEATLDHPRGMSHESHVVGVVDHPKPAPKLPHLPFFPGDDESPTRSGRGA